MLNCECAGPMTKPAEGTAKRLRAAVDAEFAYSAKAQNGYPMKRPYPSIRSAIEARISVVFSYPGTQSLSFEAAAAIVARLLWILEYSQITIVSIITKMIIFESTTVLLFSPTS